MVCTPPSPPPIPLPASAATYTCTYKPHPGGPPGTSFSSSTHSHVVCFRTNVFGIGSGAAVCVPQQLLSVGMLYGARRTQVIDPRSISNRFSRSKRCRAQLIKNRHSRFIIYSRIVEYQKLVGLAMNHSKDHCATSPCSPRWQTDSNNLDE